MWTDEGSGIGVEDREYRPAATATAPVVATKEIDRNRAIGGPLAPFGRLKSAPQVVPNVSGNQAA